MPKLEQGCPVAVILKARWRSSFGQAATRARQHLGPHSSAQSYTHHKGGSPLAPACVKDQPLLERAWRYVAPRSTLKLSMPPLRKTITTAL